MRSARYAPLRSTDPDGVGQEHQESNLQKDFYTGTPVLAGVSLQRVPTIFVSLNSDQKSLIRYAQQRHRGRMNLDFCDGHVENFKTQKFMTDDSDATRRRWNRDNLPHR